MNGLLKCTLILWAACAASGYNLGPTQVVFHFFSRSNPTTSQPLLPTQTSIMTSGFNTDLPTVITIHNFGEGVGGNFNAFLIPAHLAAESVNLLAVDWSIGASMYSEGLGNAPQCGQRIADFIDILGDNIGYNTGLIRIVGVGLGGHIAGIAARNSNFNINHIIALDPSLIGWTHHPDKLNADDANVVEVLHATAGFWGYDYPLGDVDFYPNGGRQQNGCFADISCSHTFGYAFYAESITREVEGGPEFIGTACEDFDAAVTFQCEGDEDIAFGGTAVKSDVSGIYLFYTNPQPPFARG